MQFVGRPDSLRESIEGRRAALYVLALENSRLDWASAQSGLGMGLNNLGLFEQTSKYAGEAESAVSGSLKVYTEESDPIQWAFGKNNIGDVYWNRGTIGKDKKSLEKALEYFAEARAGFERAGGQRMIPLVGSKGAVVKKAIAAL